jgi:DNA replication and repair protein RecF
MHIKSVSVRNFRNFLSTDVVIDRTVSAFLGQNGQGKTNFLEAIHICLTGESFRPGKSTHWKNNNGKSEISRVQVRLEKDGVSHELVLIVDNTKKITLNGKRISTADLVTKFPVIIFSPESLASIKGGPDLRRRLIDELVKSVLPNTVSSLLDFNRAYKSRNKILKEHLEGKHTRKSAEEILNSLNPTFLKLATQVVESRLQAIKEIIPTFQESYAEISGRKDVEISVDYVMSGEIANNWNKTEIYNALNNRLSELKNAEFDSGNTLVGPHKHDIAFLHGGKEARYFASQGQQRALILAFKMAQMVYHYRLHKNRPILLLDDVFSELDESKRDFLVKFLKRLEAQTFFTTTELSEGGNFAEESLRRYQFLDGMVQREETF